jgi:cobalt transporter subunit CbtB
MNTASISSVSTVRTLSWQPLVALAIGIFVVYTAGFSYPAALHNATHDTRHAFGLPCH